MRTDNAMSRFVDQMWIPALKIKAAFGIHPMVTITHAAHESAWGSSKLAVEDNNLFGMMATKTWLEAGKPSRQRPTWEFSPHRPERIKYWERPGDIIEKRIVSGGTRCLVNRLFRVYESWESACIDWAAKMMDLRYEEAYKAARIGDIEAFAKALEAAKYATDQGYANKLMRVAKRVDEELV